MHGPRYFTYYKVYSLQTPTANHEYSFYEPDANCACPFLVNSEPTHPVYHETINIVNNLEITSL